MDEEQQPDASLHERLNRAHAMMAACPCNCRGLFGQHLTAISDAQTELSSLRSELDAAYERAAKVIDDNQEAVSSLNNERYLQPRRAGNLMGTAYASSIRSLKSGDRDHG